MLPPELVRKIVLITLDDVPSRPELPTEPGDERDAFELSTTKPPWELIRSLTLASKVYRGISLEAWFSTFYAKSPKDLKHAEAEWPEIGSQWARTLHLVERREVPIRPPWNLQNFTRATTIRFDYVCSRAPAPQVFNAANQSLFMNVPPNIIELDLRGVIWTPPSILDALASPFRELRVLRLAQRTAWCSLCETSTIPSFQPPGPERIGYDGGFGLPLSYRKTLQSLKNLHTVVFTVGKLWSGSTILNETNNPNKWCGECNDCMTAFEDEAFKAQWIAKKSGTLPATDGWTYYELPSLKRVEWRFLPTTDVSMISDYGSDSDPYISDSWSISSYESSSE